MNRIKLLFTTLILFLFVSGTIHSQNTSKGKRKCATNDLHQTMLQNDPTYAAKYNNLQKFTNKFVDEHPNGYSPKAVITVPIIFHVILSSTQHTQFPDSRLQEQIDVLNADYGGTNVHSMGPFAASLKSNTELKFCLAKTDPSGNTTTGIERLTSTHGAWLSSDDASIKSTAAGGLDQWDPNQYLNVWVVELGGGLCGYAYYPTAPLGNIFGLVCHWEYTGVTNASPPYELGGTVTHEIGHCFNLQHIWGDSGGCSPDDACADTPPQDVETYGNPTAPLYDACSGSSTSGIMFMNFMDYVDDIAYANFTPDQKTRIQALFAPGGSLYQLGQSTVCGPPPVAPIANFTFSPNTIMQGNTVTFTDASTNSPTSWLWSFPGGTPATFSGQVPPAVTYSAPGTYNITLIVSNSAGSDTVVKPFNVTPTNTFLPDPDFYATQTTILVGGTTDFVDMTGNAPTSWLWSFEGGNPSTSNLQNPTGIQYSVAGNYKVKLTAVNFNGSDSIQKLLYIHVISSWGTQRPTVAFKASERLIDMGSTVYFTDQSTNNPASWEWTFYGGTPSTSTMQNPSGVVYSNTGYYNVKLKVSNPNGSDSLTKTEYIVVTPQQMPSICDTISNLQYQEHIYYRKLTTTSGYLPGPNGDGVKAYADKFTDYTFSEINALIVGVKISKSATQNSYVRFKVWPGTTLPLENSQVRYKDVNLNTMNPNFTKLVTFNPPVQVNGTFFVGYEVQYVQGDTFVVAMAVDRGNTGINTLYIKNSGNAWVPISDAYGIYTSLFIDPSVCLVGINEVIEDEKLLIYPNPSHDKFNIQVEDDNWQGVEIKVFDMIGKMVESHAEIISPHQYQIDMSNHKAGIYFLNIVKGNKTITKKISVIK